MTKPVCLVTGFGDATGSAIVHRFTDSCYLVAMVARSTERLDRLAEEIEDACSYPWDVGDLEAVLPENSYHTLSCRQPFVMVM